MSVAYVAVYEEDGNTTPTATPHVRHRPRHQYGYSIYEFQVYAS